MGSKMGNKQVHVTLPNDDNHVVETCEKVQRWRVRWGTNSYM